MTKFLAGTIFGLTLSIATPLTAIFVSGMWEGARLGREELRKKAAVKTAK